MNCPTCDQEIQETPSKHVVLVSIVRRGIPTPMAITDAPTIGGFWRNGRWHPKLHVLAVKEFDDD